MVREATTISISKKTRQRILTEVIHTTEERTGVLLSFNTAIEMLLDDYSPKKESVDCGEER